MTAPYPMHGAHGYGNGAVGVRPPKPGPTGPGVAIASFLVVAAVIGANLLISVIWVKAGHPSFWIYILSLYAVEGVVLVPYLLIVGRGARGRLIGGGIMFISLLCSMVNGAIWVWADDGDALAGFRDLLEVAGAVLLVIAWGLARRSGWLWTISIPAAIGLWSLWHFVLDDRIISFDPTDTVYEGWLRNTVPWTLMSWGLPILLGWGLELLGRAATNRPAAVPAVGGYPVVGMQQQYWQGQGQGSGMPSQPMPRPPQQYPPQQPPTGR